MTSGRINQVAIFICRNIIKFFQLGKTIYVTAHAPKKNILIHSTNIVVFVILSNLVKCYYTFQMRLQGIKNPMHQPLKILQCPFRTNPRRYPSHTYPDQHVLYPLDKMCNWQSITDSGKHRVNTSGDKLW